MSSGSNIDRLLDEAEKAQRKGHLVLAEVCRDAVDELGLVIEERNRLKGELEPTQMDADMQAREVGNMEYNARVLMTALEKVLARLMVVEALRISLEAKCNQLQEELDEAIERGDDWCDQARKAREIVAIANSVCGKNNCNCPGAKKVRSAIEDAIPQMPVDRVGGW